MIAADSSSLIAYLQGASGKDVDAVTTAAAGATLRLPPIVVTELLADPNAKDDLSTFLLELPLLPILDGYWERAGFMRRVVKQKGLRAKSADALIAQSCIDHGVALITRDTDFKHFAKHCALKLA